MKKVFTVLFFLLVLGTSCQLLSTSVAFAQTSEGQMPLDPVVDRFYQATVVSISPNKKTLEASENGNTIVATYEPQSSGTIHVGDTVVIGGSVGKYYFVDQYHLWNLLYLVIGFFAFLLVIVGWKGIGSIAGLLISLGVIFFYVVPQIIAGSDPLTVCMIGGVGILIVTTLVAHGISRQTVVALIGTFLALLATYFLVQLVGNIALITGYGNEEAVNLQFALPHMINLKGLFLGGIILATLGALNDITITQAASIFSLAKTEKSSFKDLANEGYSIGREHALSLVNTLLLAFAGSSLAVFIFVIANPNGQPLWVVLNSEFFLEEIIKIVAGTAGLLLAVPIVTILAALVCDKGVREYARAFFR